MSQETLTKRGVRILREEGAIELFRRVLLKFFRFDFFIRSLTANQQMLPRRHRRLPTFSENIRQGHKVYLRMVLDTGRNLDSGLKILDVGCGDGALARELHRFNPSVEYLGIDVNQKWIRRLNPRFEDDGFEFKHIDVESPPYNSNGTVSPEEVELPIANESVDIIVANSVFNHIEKRTVQRYLDEFSRVLHTDGIVWIGFHVAKQKSDRYASHVLDFEHDKGEYYSDAPGRNFLYPEDTFREMANEAGFDVRNLRYGTWRWATEKRASMADALTLEKFDSQRTRH